MCICDRDLNNDRWLSRRQLLKGAARFSAVAAVGGLGISLPNDAYGAVPNPGIANTNAWGARAPSSPVTVLNYKPSRLIIHHTATSNSTSTSQAAAYSLARSIQNYHMDNNGWIDSGQQFTISRGGYAMEGRHRSLERLDLGNSFVQGAHVGGYNSSSVGIENEGLYTSTSPPAALYDKMVEMCAYICEQYSIPTSQILGHRDFSATQCPGDVLYSMLPQLRLDVDAVLAGGSYEQIVDNTDATRFYASGNWGISSWSSQKYGSNYMYANPVLASDAAWYMLDIPNSGNYLIDAWYPSNAGYNSSTPFVIVTSSGNQTVFVNQQVNGGDWYNLGTFNMSAGDYDAVAISRWTNSPGYVIADSIRIRSA